MIEYTVMDYEGEPVTIEDGEIYWDSDDVEWKFNPDRSGSLWELETYCYYQDRI